MERIKKQKQRIMIYVPRRTCAEILGPHHTVSPQFMVVYGE